MLDEPHIGIVYLLLKVYMAGYLLKKIEYMYIQYCFWKYECILFFKQWVYLHTNAIREVYASMCLYLFSYRWVYVPFRQMMIISNIYTSTYTYTRLVKMCIWKYYWVQTCTEGSTEYLTKEDDSVERNTMNNHPEWIMHTFILPGILSKHQQLEWFIFLKK